MSDLHSKILSFLLTLSLYHPLPAQRAPQPHFRNYSTQHGLPSPEVYCAFQDSQGYLWFGTDNGAARFDGYAFRTYDAQNGLASNVVFDIYEDAKGRIWFGTMTGEAFILEGDTIVPYRFNHLVRRYRGKHQSVWLGHLGPDETAWFVLEFLGILRIDSSGLDSLITTERPVSRLIVEVEGAAKVLPNFIARRYEDKYEFWSEYTSRRRLVPIDFFSEKGSWQKEFFYQEPCKGGFNAEKLSGGQLLILSCNHLFCLQNEELAWSIPFDILVNEIIEDETQAIWLCGHYGKGLRRYHDPEALKNGKYDLFLDGLTISNFYRDTQGGIWVATVGNGVFYCSDFQLLSYDTRFGFSGDFVSSAAFKNEEVLFAGCDNGDIFQANLKSNKIEKSMANPVGYHNYDLLYQAGEDVLWSNGAFWKNGKWNFPSYRIPGGSKTYKTTLNSLNKLQLSGLGELLGCNAAGIHVIDTEKLLIKFSLAFTTQRERFFAVHVDKRGRTWAGNARGLFEFKDSSLISPGIAHPAFNNRVEDIDEFSDSSLVFGTKGWGVVCWKGEDILQITTENGLTANMIEDVHVDENSILWVGTLNGLNKITFDTTGRPAVLRPTVRRFTVANGLPSNEIYKVKSYAGQVWLCTAGGLVKFHEPEEDTLAAAPVIQHLRANGANVPLAANQELRHDNNSLEFRFLAINYRQDGRIPYRYRLSEKADWQHTENLTVNYPQLPPGAYRFEVQAQNQDGYWSPSTTHAFTILPPWWQTWWARALAGGLVLCGMFYYQRQRITRLEKEAAIRQQIAGLERSALQAQMNPHFIFNCLNSIQNFILTNEKKKAVEFLARFARLVRHNLNASVQGRVTLAEEVQILENYLALERERFNQKIDYRITVEEGLEEEDITFPPLLIQPYVENAVIHGLAKKEGGGTVAIHFQRDNGVLAVTIRDNGLGFRQEEGQAPSTRHSSVGMTITQKRLELLGSTEGRAVQVEVLKGEDGEVLGTEVRVRVGGIRKER
ncbi:MAG: histidine kinase [Phaeodactylibacter sp.]|nr:histidine kinase [Phaeodactylibacter sp.]